MKAWNLALGKDLMALRGRILEPEVILGQKGKTASYKVDYPMSVLLLSTWT